MATTNRLYTKAIRQPVEANPSDLIQASKAVHDELAKKFETRIKQVQADVVTLVHRMQKSFEFELNKQLAEANSRHLSEIKRLSETLSKQLYTESSRHEKRLEAVHASYHSVQKAYELGQAQLALLLKALPTPQVHIPENAIQMKQLPSSVYLTIPENAIEVRQVPSVVNVSVPEGKAPTVNLPEGCIRVEVDQKPSNVTVTVPEIAVPE